MEKSVKWEFDTYMQEIFQMKEVDIKEVFTSCSGIYRRLHL